MRRFVNSRKKPSCINKTLTWELKYKCVFTQFAGIKLPQLYLHSIFPSHQLCRFLQQCIYLSIYPSIYPHNIFLRYSYLVLHLSIYLSIYVNSKGFEKFTKWLSFSSTDIHMWQMLIKIIFYQRQQVINRNSHHFPRYFETKITHLFMLSEYIQHVF